MQRNKAPGPDETPMEVYEDMGVEGREVVLGILNEWWESEDVPAEELNARVVFIFKKCDRGL